MKLFEITTNFVSSSEKKTWIFKFLLLFVYLFYLKTIDYFTVYFVVVPTVFLFIRLSIKTSFWLILTCLCLDYTKVVYVPTEYGNFSSQAVLAKIFENDLYYSALHTITMLIVSLATTYMVHFYSKQTRYQIQYRTPLISFFIISSFIFFSTRKNNLITITESSIFIGLTFLSTRIWLIALTTQKNLIKSLSFQEHFLNLFTPSPYFRETYDLNSYSSNRLESQVKAFYLCLLVIFFIGVSQWINFQWFTQNPLFCPTEVGAKSFNENNASLYSYWKCYISRDFLGGYLKHLIFGGVILVAPGLVCGYNFSLPFGNIFKARSFSDFFNRSGYYYALIIRNIFIADLFKFVSKINLKSSFVKSSRFIVFMGILIGGLFFHTTRDLHYPWHMGATYFDRLLQGPLQYFTLLSVFMCFEGSLRKRLGYFRFLIYLFLLISIRHLNLFYVFNDFKDNLKFIAALFNF